MRASVRSFVAVAMTVLFLGGTTSSTIGQEASELPGVFGEVIDVRVINLEVVVTDKSGERVPGLGPESFRLLVDGEEVPIEFFSEIRDGVAMSGTGIEAGMELAPGTRPGEPVETSYLLFIDEFFSIKTGPEHRHRRHDRAGHDPGAAGPDGCGGLRRPRNDHAQQLDQLGAGDPGCAARGQGARFQGACSASRSRTASTTPCRPRWSASFSATTTGRSTSIPI